MSSVQLASSVEDSRTRIVQSVTHAAALLKALQKSGKPTALSDLARRVRLSKTATYALLRTLETEGLVARDSTARYRLSWGLYELGSAVIRPVELARIARMHLDHLAKRTGEMVLLGILDNAAVLYLDRGQDVNTFAMVANVGRRSPLHTTASGKVLLAYQEESYIDSFIRGPLAPTTTLTITEPSKLRDELSRVRRRGYAFCGQEQEIGLSSIAVPIVGGNGTVCAALAVAWPTAQRTSKVLPTFLRDLRNTAGGISRNIC